MQQVQQVQQVQHVQRVANPRPVYQQAAGTHQTILDAPHNLNDVYIDGEQGEISKYEKPGSWRVGGRQHMMVNVRVSYVIYRYLLKSEAFSLVSTVYVIMILG